MIFNYQYSVKAIFVVIQCFLTIFPQNLINIQNNIIAPRRCSPIFDVIKYLPVAVLSAKC